jgi:hypothetical protein
MQRRVWTIVLLLALTGGVATFLLPTTVRADTCGSNPYGCIGASRTGFWETGWVTCDPSQGCACPLPQRDYSLIQNNCEGQVP